MRIERAIDAFLDWRRLERDATPSSVESYRRILWKLADEYPEVEIDFLTTEDLRRFLNRGLERSAATRSNVISVLHSFFSLRFRLPSRVTRQVERGARCFREGRDTRTLFPTGVCH